MTDRLDRIEAAIESNAAQIQANSVQIQTNSAAISELHRTVSSLVQVVEIHQRNFEVIMNEIRGIRTENQRILEHLFGKEEN
jgi:archaellum component FlaC